MEKSFGIQSVIHETEINGLPYVLIRWEHSSPDEDTWEPLFNLPYEFVRKYLRREEYPRTLDQHWGSQGPPCKRSLKPSSYITTPEHLVLEPVTSTAVCSGCQHDFPDLQHL